MTDQKINIDPTTSKSGTFDAAFDFGVFRGELWGTREIYMIGGMVVAEKPAGSNGWPQLTPEFEKLLKQKVKNWIKEE